jgi:EsV-1-7 cysteine-rich motif
MGGKHKKCFYANDVCGLIASFGFKGDMAKFCSKHKEEGMVNLISKMCRKCMLKRPTFNYSGLKPEYCKDCKDDEMINVENSNCVCGRVKATFNLPGLRPKYCAKCKTPEMIDIYGIKCFCEKHKPCFNYPDQKPKYCSKCKLDGMVNVTQILCFCKRVQPSYNYEGLQAKYCTKCKLDGMIEIKKSVCFKCGINRRKFNFKGLKPELCKQCKEPGMVNIVDKCKNPDCDSCGNIKYKYYCCFCYSHLFPLDPLAQSIRHKSKEIIVRDFINENFEGFYHDTPLWINGCDCSHKRRIDHRKLIGNTLVCIETDEFQHKRYDTNDEIIRYDDLFMIHGGKFIFIRFNPDAFIDHNGEKINPDLYSRLGTLKDEIDFHIERINREENSELVEIHYLYYDQL